MIYKFAPYVENHLSVLHYILFVHIDEAVFIF
jgi:hypothetical protein